MKFVAHQTSDRGYLKVSYIIELSHSLELTSEESSYWMKKLKSLHPTELPFKKNLIKYLE